MSTSVVHPGAAKAPSGKTIGILVGGLAMAIVLGFVFYLNQGQEATVSGAGTQTADVLRDSWLVNRQAEVNAAHDRAAAYETARIQAQRPVELSSYEMIQQAIADDLAALQQARVEAQSEAGPGGIPLVSRTPMVAPALDELSYWPTVAPVEFVPGADFTLTELTQIGNDLPGAAAVQVVPEPEFGIEELRLMIADMGLTVAPAFDHEIAGTVDFYEADGSNVNPAFSHEVE